MKIEYGIITKKIDVTSVCLAKLKKDSIITIPIGDNNRAQYFGDPIRNVVKKVFIEINNIINEYDQTKQVKINILDNTIELHDNSKYDNKLSEIHSKLKIKYGDFRSELPEQKMAIRYLNKDCKVLEIGGNIGRNALIIASIVDCNNFVTMESDGRIAKQLIENRNLNNFKFHIEDAALSNRKLVQKGWNTIPTDILLPGTKWVNTISLDELRSKYKIEFDTLILDCEGAFYYILMDMPNILDNIKLIIMENDYNDITQKNYVDKVLIQNNFICDYKEFGGWGPCRNNFFEVWIR